MTDPSAQAVPDPQTVTAAGDSVLPTIDGVLTRRPRTHIDHRGALFEIHNADPDWAMPVPHIYQTSLFPGVIKGWYQHAVKIDRYTISSGEILVLLWDDREDSPTRGMSMKLALSPRDLRQVMIPARVWHCIINIGPTEALLINMPTEPYDHTAPDRVALPWDSELIPVDVRALLPQF